MTQELFEKAKFGDRFVTRGGQEALFLRLTENSEYQFADFYVKDWGQIRVNRENGKCLNGPDIENDIVGMMPSFPSNLDEAAEKYSENILANNEDLQDAIEDAFKAGAEWMAGQGWIDDGSMPPETKQESDTLQGHREWTESEPVLAWDSIYGCRVDWTRNGKWMSEQTGGYTGQVCHGIIAWRPIPEYKEKQ